MIPLVDMAAQYELIKDEILAKVVEVIESCAYIQGPYLSEFEEDFAKMHSTSFGVGCSSGTSAISLALEALGVGEGDEVIVPSFTFFATGEAVCNVGATPIFVDSNPDTFLLTPETIEPALTERTKAIIPVHLYGNPCDMPAIMAMAEERNLFVIEDSAQAHLAQFDGRSIGSFGQVATYSFYPGKNLGAYGDAGMILCSDEELAHRLRKLRNHGRQEKYTHDTIGYNHRMDAIQAGVLSVKLQYLPEWTEKRNKAAAYYDQLLEGANLKFQKLHKVDGTLHARHLYVFQVQERDAIFQGLKDRGVGAGIHYPIPLHLQPAFESLGCKRGELPVSERLADEVLSLPLFPEITQSQQEFVVDQLKELLC